MSGNLKHFRLLRKNGIGAAKAHDFTEQIRPLNRSPEMRQGRTLVGASHRKRKMSAKAGTRRSRAIREDGRDAGATRSNVKSDSPLVDDDELKQQAADPRPVVGGFRERR